MFDISDPGNVQEVTRLHMKEYYYSEALYNHHAVLIHPTVNIIGFSVEGNRENEYVQEYLVFAYENDSFVQKLKIDTKDDEGRYYTTRGTFIDDWATPCPSASSGTKTSTRSAMPSSKTGRNTSTKTATGW